MEHLLAFWLLHRALLQPEMELGSNIEIRETFGGMFYVVMVFGSEEAVHVARFEDVNDAKDLKRGLIARFLARKDKSLDWVSIIDKRYWQGPKGFGSSERWDAEVDIFRVPARRGEK